VHSECYNMRAWTMKMLQSGRFVRETPSQANSSDYCDTTWLRSLL